MRAVAVCVTCLAVVLVGLLVGRTQSAVAGSYYTIASLSGNCTDFSSDEEFLGNDTTHVYVTWDASYVYIG
jgi:hypothetical protein